MKKQFSNLGIALNRAEQKLILGGLVNIEVIEAGQLYKCCVSGTTLCSTCNEYTNCGEYVTRTC